jgi:hypothetical protein
MTQLVLSRDRWAQIRFDHPQKVSEATQNLCTRHAQNVGGMWLLYGVTPVKPTLFGPWSVLHST